MRHFVFLGAALFLSLAPLDCAPAQPIDGAQPGIAWEVRNRFRLFRYESDFQRHASAHRGDGILAAERRLASGSEGQGWARLMLNSLCVDAGGALLAECERDGVRERYLAPNDVPIRVRATHVPADATCAWTFEAVDVEPRQTVVPCAEEIRLRVPYGAPTRASIAITRADGVGQRATTEILVRDVLIAGIGDSIASGEGNPDRAIALSDAGFCFRRVVGTAGNEYFRPGRAGYRGDRACAIGPAEARMRREWARHGAQWMSAACHRSLYSYQLRVALALALENPHLTVTFVPLACTGSEIEDGLLEGRPAREVTCGGRGRKGACPARAPAQVSQMQDVLEAVRQKQPRRNFDLVLLTVGANDIRFSELVANILLDDSAERRLVARGGGIASIEDAQAKLRQHLPGDFARLRTALKPLVGGEMSRVVYVSYANPALHAGGEACPGGRAGVDIHPAFTLNGELLARATRFVEREFLPTLKALATCEAGAACRDPTDRMSFVDAHQPAFRDRGFCARAESDPEFDRACFSASGESFRASLREASERPLACDRKVREFRPYAPRARWVRTATDSYFMAMTYPDGLPSIMQPADIHDALWGVLSAVYGGAIHPTAEGHAAMADAALPAARRVLEAAGLLAGSPAGDLPMQ